MLRKLLIVSLLAAVAAAPAHAQRRTLLMPGVTYERQVQFTPRGPVALHVMFAPKPGGAWSLKPVLAKGMLSGTERVSAMQRQLADATAAGVNGDRFSPADGRPTGIVMQSGVLHHPPVADRSSLAIGADGILRVEKVRLFGTWRGLGQRRAMDLNEAPGPNGVSLFTPVWGAATPALPGAVEAVIQPLPATAPNADIVGPVVQLTQNGGTPIPADGAVLVARGTAAGRLLEEARPGTAVTLRLLLNPGLAGVADAIGGGPALVVGGKPIFRADEAFAADELARHARTGVGQLADGRIVFVVADGRRPGYSVGLTNFELAQTLARLGAVTGIGLDTGASSTMAFDGMVLNVPSDGGERPVAEGLFVLYAGVHAAPPPEPVLSPNGDGVAEEQSLAYKVARPSRVVVSLIGPSRRARVLEQAAKEPGLYRFTWDGTNSDGTPAAEGQWRFVVTGVDARGQTTKAERAFALNRTLAGLRVSPAVVRIGAGGVLAARFTLTRPALVTATLRTRTGAIVTTIAQRRLRAGVQTVTWGGRAGNRLVASGRYVVRVRTSNAAGVSELDGQVTVRRAAARAATGG